MPFQDDNDSNIGLDNALPSEVKEEMAYTNLIYQTVNMDVERAEVAKPFKDEWKSAYMYWARYAASHSGPISTLRDEVYRRVIEFRKDAERFRSVLVKMNLSVTPIPSRSVPYGTPDNGGIHPIVKWLFGIPLGFVVIKWLWNKAGKQTVLLQGPDGEQIEVDADSGL